MSIQALREQRAAKAKALNELLEANPDKWGDELQATYDAGINEIDAIDGKINRQTALNERVANAALDGNLIEAGDRLARDKQSPSAAIFSKWLRGGDQALNAEDWASIRNTLSTTTGSEGGFSVQKDVAKVIADALKAYGGMRACGATILNTDQGNPIDFPTSDGTSELGEQLAENTTSTNADPVFGVVNLTTYKFSSKDVAVPIELLQDSAVDIEAFIRARLVARLGRITNLRFTTGTGTGQPLGIATADRDGDLRRSDRPSAQRRSGLSQQSSSAIGRSQHV
jgi:HK97 family phage major capsid protein